MVAQNTRKLKIPHGGWILVGDGRKALVLRNAGDELYPNLKIESVFEAPDNPATREHGSGQPGRSTASNGRRSVIEQTDWHDIAEHRFASEVAGTLDELHRTRVIDSLVIVAPPRTLADLRAKLSDDAKRAIVAEIDKDLTRHPVYEIERLLCA